MGWFIDFINDHPGKEWDWWNWVSISPNITMQDVLDNPDQPWDWGALSANPNITFQDILDHPDKPWDWDGVSANKFLLENVQRTLKEKYLNLYMYHEEW